jgi:hypothetical protein
LFNRQWPADYVQPPRTWYAVNPCRHANQKREKNQMELSDSAKDVLNELAMAKGDAYLLGKPDGELPFSLVNKAATGKNRIAMGSGQLVGRSVVLELANARLVQDDAWSGETFRAAFRISEKGRRQSSSLNPAPVLDRFERFQVCNPAAIRP